MDKILECFKFNIKKHGIKIVVLDPFANMFDETDYKKQGKMLTKMSMFARQNNILFVLVAHPRKLEKNPQTGHFPMPTMYDISGSADFWNRADYGICLRRNQEDGSNVFMNNGQIGIQKVKYKHLGQQGIIDFVYNYNNGRYVLNGKSVDYWDNSNWLIENKQEQYYGNHETAFEDENECPF